MKTMPFTLRPFFLCLIIILTAGTISHAQNLYWVGGNGNWTNPSKWSNTSGGAPALVIPDQSRSVVIDGNSGLTNGSLINIPSGTHSMLDFTVSGTAANFKLNFNATTGNTYMYVHGDLKFLSTHSTQYGAANYVWYFLGQTSGPQTIDSQGKNMKKAEFLNENVNYELSSPLIATEKVKFHGGTLKTNNHNISTAFFEARDTNGSCCPYTKVINAGTSTINCETFDATFVYGSLNLSGDYTIKANIFKGPPSSPPTAPHSINSVVLKDYQATSSFTDNNFSCKNCELNEVIIENVFETRFAENFTVNALFEVQEPGADIIFNTTGLNGDEFTFNGNIVTPAVTNCEEQRVLFKNLNAETTTFIRNSGTLSIQDAELSDIIATGGANFILENGILTGSSSGWTESGAPATQTFNWTGIAGDSLWNNPLNWNISGSSFDCVPTINDHVILNNLSPTQSVHVIIPADYTATCKNISRSSILQTATIYFRGDFNVGSSELQISGSCTFPDNLTINSTSSGTNNVEFISNSSNTITCPTVEFPSVSFTGENGSWKLLSDLHAKFLSNNSGTFITNDNDITITTNWAITSALPTILNLGSSDISVAFSTTFAGGVDNDIELNAGTSHITTASLSSFESGFYNVTLTNTSPLDLDFVRYHFNKLTLSGNDVSPQNTIETDSLIFTADGSELIINLGDSLIVNNSIFSSSSSGTPTIIRSSTSGAQRLLYNSTFNLCVEGPIEFRDMNAEINGIIHAPAGFDGGNNTNINFSSSNILTPLYWIGEKGNWDQQSNWSNLSGGCPVIKNPNTANKLVFDNNSFNSAQDTISLPILTNCKTLEFLNTAYPAIFDVQTRLNPLQIFVDEATVHFTGAKMFVQVKTDVLTNSTVVIDITDGVDPKFDTPTLLTEPGSNLIIKNDTKVIVRD